MVQASGEAAAELPWLSPCAASLIALARRPVVAVWPSVRTDPGAVLLLVRHALPPSLPLNLKTLPALIDEQAALSAAREHLHIQIQTPSAAPFAKWDEPVIQRVYHTSLSIARLAHQLATECKHAEPELAWAAGLLAPLGWLTLAAVAPAQVEACLQEARFAEDGILLQQRHFGRDVAAVARRVNQRWRLPAWLSVITGHSALSAEMAKSMGAEEDLFRIVQLAVALVEERHQGLGLEHQAAGTVSAALHLDETRVHAWCDAVVAEPCTEYLPTWEPPESEALLPELLNVAIDNRRLHQQPATEQLHHDIDTLHHALREHSHHRQHDVHTQKMTAMAEFAAGAAHEINNPLAVISGQAQYLLNRNDAPEPGEALHKIIGQTRRVHQILKDVLQFARPNEPVKQAVDAGALMQEAAGSLKNLADDAGVKLICSEPPTAITLTVDPKQIRRALSALLQNAIEAAPEHGWAGVRIELPLPDVLHFLVEDNGKGPAAHEVSMLFDPFYSGREAGRGRGMGLPIAWRLARLHAGEVFLEPQGAGPTRFILRLPLASVDSAAKRNGVHERRLPAGVDG